MEFIHESNRIFACAVTGELLAEITFPACGGHTVIIDHTYVHPSLRGQQIGDKLMRLALADIRASGRDVRVSCPYAVRWLQDHPDVTLG